MTHQSYRTVRWLCTLALTGGASLSAAAAMPVRNAAVITTGSRHIPANAAFYAGWAGQVQSWPGYKASRLALVLNHSHIADFFTQDVPAIIAAYSKGNRHTIQNARRAGHIATLFFNHPFALYVLPISKANPTQPSMGLILKAGQNRNKIIVELKKLPPLGGQYRNTPLKYASIGSVGPWIYDFINPTPAMLAALRGQGKLLVSDFRFQKAMAQSVRRPVWAAYVNCSTARGDEKALVSYANGNPLVKKLSTRLNPGDASRAYRSFAMSGGFFDGQWRQDDFLAYAHAPAQRGHAMMLLKLVPAKALSCAVFHLNLTAVANGILAAAKADGQWRQINESLQTVNEMTGVDLRQDLIRSLGTQWLIYELPTPGTPIFNDYVVLNRLRHPNRLMQALAVLMPVAAMGGNAMVKQHGLTGEKLTLNAVQMGNVTINEVGTATARLYYAIDNNNFFITFNLQTMRAAIKQESAKTSLVDNPAFQQVMAKLDNPRSPVTISFSDSPKLLAAGYQLLTQDMERPLAIAGIQLPVPLTQIAPPITDLAAGIEPSGSVGWFDHAGWHKRSISAFPLAGIFTAQSPAHYLGLFSAALTGKTVAGKKSIRSSAPH
ncbi:MAG: hypothetical protein M0Z50_06845 [Planctomycetia bacterium]|nr:hypothetical protein [Planctomycetia bacterium]